MSYTIQYGGDIILVENMIVMLRILNMYLYHIVLLIHYFLKIQIVSYKAYKMGGFSYKAIIYHMKERECYIRLAEEIELLYEKRGMMRL